MYTLVCNLDPDWDFANLLHNYSVDLFADPNVGFWEASNRLTITKKKPWGDWPRRIEPRHLNDELTETLYLHRDAPRLLLFNLPALTGEALQQRIQDLAPPLAEQDAGRYCRVVTLPKPTDSANLSSDHPELLAIATTTWIDHLVLLSESDSAAETAAHRLYELRLLMMIFANEEALQLRQFRRRRVVSLKLIKQATRPHLSDTASQRWQLMAQDLLSAGDSLRNAAPSHGIQQWENDTATGFAAIDELRTRTDPTPPSCPVLKLPCPWFFQAGLPAHHRAEVARFYQELEAGLEERFEVLNSQHQALQKEYLRQEATFLETLQTHTALDLGLHDQARAVLARQKQARIAQQRQLLLAEEQQVLARLRGDLVLETRRNAESPETAALTGELTLEARQGVHLYGGTNRHYRRPLFQEDETLEKALDAAQTAAARLASLGWLIGGGVLTVALALIPILALRLPHWPGWPSYASDPRVWGLDAGWLAAFGLSYLGTSLFQVYRQRRALRQKQAALKPLTVTIHQRSHQALSDTFRYQRLTLAMRRLLVIEEQIDRLLKERETALRDLAALESSLSNQLEHYQTQRLVVIPAAFPPDEAGLLRERLQAQPPGTWLHRALQPWPVRPDTLTELTDSDFGQRAPLPTSYLQGCAEILLTRVLPDQPV